MKRPYFRPPPTGPFIRINGKIRAREVRVIGVDGQQLGVLPLGDAINLARTHQVDLVEVAPNATPPVCRLVDYGKYRYELAKREKEAKKHQHANRVKEIQLTATIDPHDLEVKLSHAVDFLCEEMKVKASLRFRGREMAHKEFGFQTLEKFVRELAPYGQPDAPPKLAGRNLNVMISPLPRTKRAPNPHRTETDEPSPEPDISGNSDDPPSGSGGSLPNSNRAEAPSPSAASSVVSDPAYAKLGDKIDA